MIIQRLARWLRPSRSAQTSHEAGAAVERLEGRQLMAAGPQITNIQLQGTAKACTAIVLTFNEQLDPNKAGDIRAFSIGRVKHPSSDNGLNLGDFLPFLARPLAKVIKNRKVQFSQDIYDDTTNTITLIPNAPFAAWKYFRAVRIRGNREDRAAQRAAGKGELRSGVAHDHLPWVRFGLVVARRIDAQKIQKRGPPMAKPDCPRCRLIWRMRRSRSA